MAFQRRGKKGSRHEFTNNSFAFHELLRNKYLRFHGKPAVGGFERTGVCSYIKGLKSEVKSSHH